MRRNLASSFKCYVVLPLMLMLAFSLFMTGAKAAEPLIDLGAELKSIKDKNAQASSFNQPTKQPATQTTRPVANSSAQNSVAQEQQTPQDKKQQSKASPPLKEQEVEWGYSGDYAPKYWDKLSPEFALCGTGKNQSPIDLRDKNALGTQGLSGLDIAYKEVPLKIINDGHAVQVNYPLGSYIKVGEQRYELMQYHFHTPSEHYKEGFAYPMEIQFVHRDGDGNIVIMAVLFQEGERNPNLNALLARLPKEVGKEMLHREVRLNPATFLPANTEFYKYNGSLTTPPCSEGVYWMVFKQPIEASAGQIRQLSTLMGENARPVQPLFARDLLKSWAEPEEDTRLYEFY